MVIDLVARRWVRSSLVLLPPLAFYMIFFILPMAFIVTSSLSVSVGESSSAETRFSLENYFNVLFGSYYWSILGRTLGISLVVTAISIVLGYAIAYTMIRFITSERLRALVFILVLAPLFTASIVRALGWIVILGPTGWVSTSLQAVHLQNGPLSPFGTGPIIVGLVQILAPFMVISIANILRDIDPAVEEASADLGARPSLTFAKVVLPLTAPGIVAGSLIVFTLAVSSYAVPFILGGGKVTLLPMLIYDEFMVAANWGLGSALAAFLIIPTLLIGAGMNRMVARLKPEEAHK